MRIVHDSRLKVSLITAFYEVVKYNVAHNKWNIRAVYIPSNWTVFEAVSLDHCIEVLSWFNTI